MPTKLGAQCAFGVFTAILMTGIFPEARAEPVFLRPPASPRGTIEIAQAGSGKPTRDTGPPRWPSRYNHGLSAASPPRKEGKDSDRRRPQPHRGRGQSSIPYRPPYLSEYNQ